MGKQAESLVKGTMILTIAALVARVLGVVQRVPLQHILDDTGMATYGIAYNLYFMLLIVAVAGMPTAISKLVSGQLAVGDLEAAKRTYRLALWFGTFSGSALALLMVLLAPWYSEQAGVPEARAAIWCVAPSMVLFPIIAMMRGWYQGHRFATPSGHSQIVEQIFRVGSTVALAFAGVTLGLSEEPVVALAVLGGTIGGIGALWILIRARKQVSSLQQQAMIDAAKTVAPEHSAKAVGYTYLFKLSVPVSIAALAVPMVYFLDSSLIIPLLQDSLGYLQAKATVGIMTARAQTLAALPPILAIALSASVVPIISAAAARKDQTELSNKAGQALRLATFAATPFIVLLTLATPMINRLIFGNGNGNDLIMLMIIGSMFQISMTVTNGLLNGLGKTTIPMMHVIVGIVLKLGLSVALAPVFGIRGIILATMAGFLTVTILNRIQLSKSIEIKGALNAAMIRFYAGSLLIGAAGLCTYDVLMQNNTRWFSHLQPWLVDLLFLFIICIVVGVGFAILMIRGRVMRTSEWAVVPRRIRDLCGRWFLAEQ